MRKIIRVALWAAFFSGAGLSAVPVDMVNGSTPAYVPDQVLVKFESGMSKSARSSLVRSVGGQVVRSIPQLDVVTIQLPAGKTVEQSVEAYAAMEGVVFAEPNGIVTIAESGDTDHNPYTNDPFYDELWGLYNPGGVDIEAEKAWNFMAELGATPGDCSSIIVAVVDTGVSYTHGDLKANMWDGGTAFPNHGYDTVGQDDDPLDGHGHGTHVAGTIAAVGNNGLGVVGVCHKTQIMAVKVLSDSGSGTYDQVAEGMVWAGDHGAKVLNMSLGGTSTTSTLNAAADYLEEMDVLVAAAAGNSAKNSDVSPHYPSALPNDNILSVAALNSGSGLAYFSNWGLNSVDTGAPGQDIKSTWWTYQEPIYEDTFFDDAGALTWMGFGPDSSDWGAFPNDAGVASCIAGASEILAVPADYCVGPPYPNYGPDRLAGIYKQFNFAPFQGLYDDQLVIEFERASELGPGDSVTVLMQPQGGSPVPGGVPLGAAIDENSSATGTFTSNSDPVAGPTINDCLTPNCSIGLLFESDSNATMGVDLGLSFWSFTLTGEGRGSGYHTISGTSMATPHTAGIATLVRSVFPEYTAKQVVDVITWCGNDLDSLNGKVKSGRAASAYGALTCVLPPENPTIIVEGVPEPFTGL